MADVGLLLPSSPAVAVDNRLRRHHSRQLLLLLLPCAGLASANRSTRANTILKNTKRYFGGLQAVIWRCTTRPASCSALHAVF
ncbi:hypothetical protein COO60DRAFT_1537754, partial [Scenedesmus sp. NREL 46B-D3]